MTRSVSLLSTMTPALVSTLRSSLYTAPICATRPSALLGTTTYTNKDTYITVYTCWATRFHAIHVQSGVFLSAIRMSDLKSQTTVKYLLQHPTFALMSHWNVSLARYCQKLVTTLPIYRAVVRQHGCRIVHDPDCNAGCPSWTDPRSNPVKINRKTLGWNAAAGCFAYSQVLWSANPQTYLMARIAEMEGYEFKSD